MAELVQRSGLEVASSTPLEDVEESFVQVLDLHGRLLDGAGTAHLPALSPAELELALLGDTWVQRVLPGVDGKARILARSVMAGEQLVVVVGQSLVNRDEAVRDVRNSFAFVGRWRSWWGPDNRCVGASIPAYWLRRNGG